MTKGRNQLSDVIVHIRGGFVATEHPHVRSVLATLRQHLGRWDDNDVGVEVSLRDRGRRDQCLTLRTTLPGLEPFVAVAGNSDLTCALHAATHDLIRQLAQQRIARVAPTRGRSAVYRPR